MMEQIYELKVGDVFSICDGQAAFSGRYRVEKLVENVAVCRSEEDDTRLMMPLFVPMPFAVLAGQRRPAPASHTISIAIPAGAAVVQSEAEAPEAETPAQEPRRVGSILYFNRQGHWGKISNDRMQRGVFFHISQVEDEALKECLDQLPQEGELPEVRVSYVVGRNPQRLNSICATQVRLEMGEAETSAAEPVREESAQDMQEAPAATEEAQPEQSGC